jgi:hypothetical protein
LCIEFNLGNLDLVHIFFHFSFYLEASHTPNRHYLTSHFVHSNPPLLGTMAARRDPRAFGTASSSPGGIPFDSVQNTPDTHITAFSRESAYGIPGLRGIMPMVTPQQDVFAGPSYCPPAHFENRGTSQYEQDPFIDSHVGLSAAATAFQPGATYSKGKAAATLLPEGSPTISSALSHDMEISHRLEVCDTPIPSVQDVGDFLTVSSSACSSMYVTH